MVTVVHMNTFFLSQKLKHRKYAKPFFIIWAMNNMGNSRERSFTFLSSTESFVNSLSSKESVRAALSFLVYLQFHEKR